MNDELEIAKTSKIIRVLNIAMIVFNSLMALGIIAITFARKTYAEISNQLFSPEGPLMNSVLLDFLLRKKIAILVVLFIVVLVIKEINVKSIRARLFINFLAFIALSGYASLLIYLIYSPVIATS